MHKFFLSTVVALGCFSSASADNIGIVNFSACLSESKIGKKEQENIDTLRKQMASMMEDTENKLRDLSAKFEDNEYLESLSPQAEEEMKMTYQNLQENLSRNQQQFYQIIQGANYQLYQTMSNNIAAAAEKIAQEKNLDYVINREACFYVRPGFDVTSSVVEQMDKIYESETKNNKISENNAINDVTADGAN